MLTRTFIPFVAVPFEGGHTDRARQRNSEKKLVKSTFNRSDNPLLIGKTGSKLQRRFSIQIIFISEIYFSNGIFLRPKINQTISFLFFSLYLSPCRWISVNGGCLKNRSAMNFDSNDSVIKSKPSI